MTSSDSASSGPQAPVVRRSSPNSPTPTRMLATRVDEHDRRLGGDDRARVDRVLGQEHGERAEEGQRVGLPVAVQRVQSDAANPDTTLVQAAVNAKLIDAAVPNIAARHQRGPRSASTAAITMPPAHAPPATIHSHSGGDSVPSTGSAKYRKPARPAAHGQDAGPLAARPS